MRLEFARSNTKVTKPKCGGLPIGFPFAPMGSSSSAAAANLSPIPQQTAFPGVVTSTFLPHLAGFDPTMALIAAQDAANQWGNPAFGYDTSGLFSTVAGAQGLAPAALLQASNFRTRITEYKIAIRRRDPFSLVFAHALEFDHRFNWDETEVIAMANTKQTREFLEAWHSSTTSINRHVDLDSHYEGLRAQLTDLRPQPNNSHLSFLDHAESHSLAQANAAAALGLITGTPTGPPPPPTQQQAPPTPSNSGTLRTLGSPNGTPLSLGVTAQQAVTPSTAAAAFAVQFHNQQASLFRFV
ncbi:unnamed protein product [Schistocephalus solidus]|uniref:Uncharacterized protein n=1 Tax=Schistocephalus solidus TaxID=70667 RepID=A0A183ST83_SCHSO|nr:unnamed protein product [Schistocephalus solidus]